MKTITQFVLFLSAFYAPAWRVYFAGKNKKKKYRLSWEASQSCQRVARIVPFIRLINNVVWPLFPSTDHFFALVSFPPLLLPHLSGEYNFLINEHRYFLFFYIPDNKQLPFFNRSFEANNRINKLITPAAGVCFYPLNSTYRYEFSASPTRLYTLAWIFYQLFVIRSSFFMQIHTLQKIIKSLEVRKLFRLPNVTRSVVFCTLYTFFLITCILRNSAPLNFL